MKRRLQRLWVYCGPELGFVAFMAFVAWSVMASDARRWWPF